MTAAADSGRVFVLGIDGAPHSLLTRLAAGGVMPRLAELIADRNTAQIDSVLPTVSNVAWASFQTGKNPGKFDIFGFAELQADLSLRLPNAAHLRGETIQEIVSRAGRRVISLGLPSSYPPRAVNGLLVGGFLAPSVEKATWPPDRAAELARLGYKLDVDPVKARQDAAYLKRELPDVLAGRRRTVEALLAEPWDLFLLHVMETDRLNHFFWRAGQAGGEDAAFFEGVYRQVDGLIGAVADAMRAGDTLIVMSDHGFCEVRREVQLNRWLVRKGYLRVSGDPVRQMFQAVAADSRAVALVPGRVHLLTADAFKQGRLTRAQADELTSEIVAKLRTWTDEETRQRICNRVLTRDEAFTGPYIARGPDVIIDPRDGYDLKAALTPGELLTPAAELTGMHTYYDAFLLVAGRELTRDRRCVTDITRTVLDLLAVPAPPDLDSRGVLA